MTKRKLTDAELLDKALKQERRAQEAKAKLRAARDKKRTGLQIMLGKIHFAAAQKAKGWTATREWLDWVEKNLKLDMSTTRAALDAYIAEEAQLEALRRNESPAKAAKAAAQTSTPPAAPPPEPMPAQDDDDPENWAKV